MHSTYTYPRFAYRQSDEQRQARPSRHPVVVIGAGPIGLTAALECAARGLPVVVLDDNDTVSIGSRAVCYAKRPLEIWDRLGVAPRMVEKGVSWKLGKVFFEDRDITGVRFTYVVPSPISCSFPGNHTPHFSGLVADARCGVTLRAGHDCA